MASNTRRPLPPAKVSFGTEPYKNPPEFIQSSRNRDETQALRDEPLAPRMAAQIGRNDEYEAPPNGEARSAAPARGVKFSWGQNTKKENTARQTVSRYPDVIRREALKPETERDQPVSRLDIKSGYRQVMKREEEVAKPISPQVARDRRAETYDVSVGRWPALFEASHNDYFDEVMAVWLELSHSRRLSREQAGDIWSE